MLLKTEALTGPSVVMLGYLEYPAPEVGRPSLSRVFLPLLDVTFTTWRKKENC